MTPNGYAIVSPGETVQWDARSNGHHISFTSRLGCTDTYVDCYRFRADERITLSTAREALCVPLETAGELHTRERYRIPASGIARLPAGVAGSIGGKTDTSWIVVSAQAETSSPGDPVVLDTETLEFEEPTTSDILTARLTARLACRGMKVNVRLLQPGDVVPYHTEGSQEELFVPLTDEGVLRVAGTTHSLQPGDVARVAPNQPRAAANETDRECRWLMIGAPPTGGPHEWDPGAEILE